MGKKTTAVSVQAEWDQTITNTANTEFTARSTWKHGQSALNYSNPGVKITAQSNVFAVELVLPLQMAAHI